MIRVFYCILFGIMSMLSPYVAAIQVVHVKDNRINKIIGSSNDMTRLYVKQDFITDIWTTSTDINIQQDEENGEVFLTNSNNNTHLEASSMILKTAKGDRINIIVDMTHKGPQVVELITGVADSTSSKTDDHRSKIVSIIKQMHFSGDVPGWEKVKKRKIKHLTIPEVYSKTTSILQDGIWQIAKILLTNKNDYNIVLSPAIFELNKLVSVAFTSVKLKPGEETFAYIIRELG